MTPAVSVIVVAYDGPADALDGLLESLSRQSLAPSQILCVDQSQDGRFRAFLQAEPAVEVLAIPENIGYSSACNRAVQRAAGEYLMFINPDAQPAPSCLAELVAVLQERPGAAVVGAQVLLPDHQTVNAGDNTVHISGLAWSGRYGLPAESGPPRPAAAVSGAAMLVRRSVFEALGGYTEGFFMYYDDVDLAWRVRLAGWEVLFCPSATVTHEYDFTKGGYKWRYLERNRWWCLLAHLDARTLLALAPLLAAVEAAIVLRARGDGWLSEKLAAWRLLWDSREALSQRRRQIQRLRRVPDSVIVQRMSAAVDSPFISSSLTRRLEPALGVYRAMVLAITRLRRRQRRR